MDVVVLEDGEALANHVAREWAQSSAKAIQERGQFSVAVPGGTTPRRLYEILAHDPEVARHQSTVVFVGDERCVPRDHPHSNHRMLRETLLDHVPGFLSRSIEPIPEDITSEVTDETVHKRLASDYAEAIEKAVGAHRTIDLIVLGLGNDGHVASLFPPALEPNMLEPLIAPVIAPRSTPVPRRITLTYGAMRSARDLWILVSGTAKAEILRRALLGEGELPVTKVVRDRAKNVRIWADRAATVRLPRDFATRRP